MVDNKKCCCCECECEDKCNDKNCCGKEEKEIKKEDTVK